MTHVSSRNDVSLTSIRMGERGRRAVGDAPPKSLPCQLRGRPIKRPLVSMCKAKQRVPDVRRELEKSEGAGECDPGHGRQSR